MGAIDLSGKRVLLTQSGEFMGPVLAEVLSELGATVIGRRAADQEGALKV